MGPPKVRWSEEEEVALREGVQKYGIGKWKSIKTDDAYKEILWNRSNVDLKDKWRNILAAEGIKPIPPSKKAKNKKSEQAQDQPRSSGKDTGKRNRNGRANAAQNGSTSKMSTEEMITAAILALNEDSATAEAIHEWIQKRYENLSKENLKEVNGKLKSMLTEGRLVKDGESNTFKVDMNLLPSQPSLPPKKAKMSQISSKGNTMSAVEVAVRAIQEAEAAAKAAEKAAEYAEALEQQARSEEKAKKAS